MLDTFDKQKLYDNFTAALSKAWESYIKLIDLLLGLAGATALVFVGSIKVSDWATLPNKHLIMWVFIFSGLSLICGASWRFASQYFMEYETLGSRTVADLYFNATEIDPVTTSHLGSRSLRRLYKVFFRLFPLPTGFFLLCAWVTIFFVFFGQYSILSQVK
jgi:hypothetical protein